MMDSTKIYFAQLNCQHSKYTEEEFHQSNIDNNIDIAIITEPYTDRNNNAKEKKSTRCFQRHTDTHSSVKCIVRLYNDQINATIQSEYSNNNVIVIDITFKSTKIRICSFYNPPSNQDVDSLIDCLQNAYNSCKSNRFLLAGDTNAHHKTWDRKSRPDKKGEKFHNFIFTNSLDLCNVGSTPTFSTVRNGRTYTSSIDITANSPALDLQEWQVSTDYCVSSDHNTIRFNIETSPPTNNRNFKRNDKLPTSTFRYRTSKADWNHFEEELKIQLNLMGINEESLSNIINHADTNSAASRLTQSIVDACDATIPTRGRNKPSKAPWWNHELDQLKNEVIKQKRQIANSNAPNKEHMIKAYQETKMHYSNLIKSKANNNFKEFIQNRTTANCFGTMKQILKDIPRKQPETTVFTQGKFSNDPETTASAILNHFYPDSADNIIPHTPNHIFDNHPITDEEIIKTTTKMNKDKAPGRDGITADILQHSIKTNISLFRILFNKCLEIGSFPDCWKQTEIKLIPKPNKDDYASLTSYRPIGLIPVIGKTLETIMAKRIEYSLKHNDELSTNQFGFTPQTSCIHALHNAIDRTKREIEQKKQVVMISLDIASAFNNVKFSTILSAMQKRNVPQNLLLLTRSYFENRTINLKVHGDLFSKSQTKGCIQGSTCGPLFWNIALDDIFRLELPSNCYLQAFADDILLIASSTNTANLNSSVTTALNIIHD